MRIIETTLDKAMNMYPGVKELVLSQDDDSVMYGIMMYGQLGGFKKHRYIKVRIALDGDEPVAWAWTFNYNRICYPDIGARGHAYMVFVKPKYRRNGLAKKFYDWALGIARRSRRSLHVFPWDNKSHSFYEKVKARKKYRYID